jgi:DNA-binding transcriptional MerR regulator
MTAKPGPTPSAAETAIEEASYLSTDSLLTIDMFAKRVRLTPRTVRSYHSRGILQPPVRISRTPYYGGAHMIRMQAVFQMQRNGLPLEAIRALLNPDRVLAEFAIPAKRIAAILQAEPGLRHTLTRAGVLRKEPDGTLSVVSMRAVVATRASLPPGTPLRETLLLLAHTVIAVRPLAEAAIHLVRSAMRDDAGPPDELADLTAEAVRLSLLTSASTGSTHAC